MLTVQPYGSDEPEQPGSNRAHDPVMVPAPRLAPDQVDASLDELLDLGDTRRPPQRRPGHRTGTRWTHTPSWLCLASRILDAWGSTLRALTLLCVLLAGAVTTAVLATQARTPFMGLPLGLALTIGLAWTARSRPRPGHIATT